MLGVRLSDEIERQLDRHARDLGRTKSALVRDWIVERLERESIDAQMREAARILAAHYNPAEDIEADWDD